MCKTDLILLKASSEHNLDKSNILYIVYDQRRIYRNCKFKKTRGADSYARMCHSSHVVKYIVYKSSSLLPDICETKGVYSNYEL